MNGPFVPKGSTRLLVNGRDVAPVHVVARTHREKGRGLLGTSGVEGALWLQGASSVHMLGMRYAIDAAVVDADGVVLHVSTLQPWTGMTRPRLRGRAVIEAAAGAMNAWGAVVGARMATTP